MIVALLLFNFNLFAQNCPDPFETEIGRGGFENINTSDPGCSLNGTTILDGFRNGCASPWFAPSGNADLVQSLSNNSGNSGSIVNPYEGQWFAQTIAVSSDGGSTCNASTIAQTLTDLVPDVEYTITFRHRYYYPTLDVGRIDVDFYMTSGLTNTTTANNLEPCLGTLPGQLIGTLNNYNQNDVWEEYTLTFVADGVNDQFVISPKTDENGNYRYLVDDFSIEPCVDETDVTFDMTYLDENEYQFTNTTFQADVLCWDFNDGTISTDLSPTHIFSGNGPHSITLTTVDVDGCVSTGTQNIGGNLCECSEFPIHIGGNVTMNSNQTFGNDLIIDNGADLDVVNSTLSFATDCKIYLERNARLDGVNSIFTSACIPNRWEGIVVEGNIGLIHPTQNEIFNDTYPNGVGDHGVVYLQDGTVEYASFGVTTPRLAVSNGNAYRQGGIIVVDDVDFLRNGTGVHIGRFGEYYVQSSNIGLVKNCTFDLNTGVNVNISRTHGVGIIGNYFDLFYYGGTAIGMYGATGAIFSNNLNGNLNAFLTTGIYASYAAGTVPPGDLLIGGSSSFEGNTFNGLYYGVISRNCNVLVVQNNQFNTGSGGLFVDGTSDFLVEKNTFRAQHFYNVRYSETGNSSLNESLCNEYITVEDQNGSAIDVHGFNKGYRFNGERFDDAANKNIHIFANSSSAGEIAFLQGQQNAPVYNLFSGNENIISSTSPGETVLFEYHHPNANETAQYPNLIPLCDITGTGCASGISPNNFRNEPVPPGTTDSPECLELFGLTGDPGGRNKSNAEISQSNYQSSRSNASTMQAVLDMGDSDELLSYVQAGDLSQISLATPYLSDDILNAIIFSDALEVSDKADILLTHAPLSGENLANAQNLTEEFAAQYEDAIAGKGLSPRQNLEGQRDIEIGFGNFVLRKLAAEATVNNDESIVEVLSMDNTEFAKVLLFNYHLHQGNTEAAQMTLNSYDTVTGYQQTIKESQQTVLNSYQFPEEFSDEETWDYINGLLDDSALTVNYYGQGLAGELFGEIYLPTEENIADENSDESDENELIPSEQLTVYPNPTTGYLTLELPFTPQESLTYNLYDLSGIIIDKGNLSRMVSTLNLSEVSTGVYFLHVEGRQFSEKVKIVLLP